MSTKKLQGTVLITGASSGIGAVYADRMARRGHDLILVARDEQRLHKLSEHLQWEAGVKIDVLRADLTQKMDLAQVEQRLRTDESIGTLINNAGVAISGSLAEADPEQIENLILLNVLAPTQLAAAAVAGFLVRGGGTLINICSVLALMPERFNGPYSGTKAYMLNLSLNQHQDVSGKGIRVQAVLPGATKTEIWERAGIDSSKFPASVIMEVDEMVDAALVGLDRGEVVTIPSLPDPSDWESLTAARHKLAPNLSLSHAAARYRT